jgi:hypothetical protein
MEVTETTFGTVTRNGTETLVSASGATLRDWARRGDCSWPCSVLAQQESVTAVFDSRGDLVGLDGDEGSLTDLPADELNAWTSETLIRAGYPNHPAIRA